MGWPGLLWPSGGKGCREAGKESVEVEGGGGRRARQFSSVVQLAAVRNRRGLSVRLVGVKVFEGPAARRGECCLGRKRNWGRAVRKAKNKGNVGPR